MISLKTFTDNQFAGDQNRNSCSDKEMEELGWLVLIRRRKKKLTFSK